MKTKLLTLTLAITASFSALTPSSAIAGCHSNVLRSVQSIDATTDRLICEYREQLQGRRTSCSERELLQALYTMDRLTDDLRSSVENGDSPSCQIRIFSAMKSQFCSTKSIARDVRLCPCVKELMACVDGALVSIGNIGFGYEERPRYDRERDYGRYEGPSRSREGPSFPRGPSREEMIINGIFGLLGGR